jgi:hypothetical protein
LPATARQERSSRRGHGQKEGTSPKAGRGGKTSLDATLSGIQAGPVAVGEVFLLRFHEFGRGLAWPGGDRLQRERCMNVEKDSSGNFVIDPVELASRFALTPDDFRSRMQQGLVVSIVEIGHADDEGTSRLSLRLGNRLWRAVIDMEGRVIDEALTFVSGKMRKRAEAAPPRC